MHPLMIVAIPVTLIALGMVLNSIGLSFDQPPSSPEQDPVKRRETRLAAEKQKRIGQYGWLVILATIGAFIWFYIDTVNTTVLSSRVAALQTLGSQEGKDMILALTLSDGSNVKYVIKLPQASESAKAAKEQTPKQTISAWELERLGTAFSVGVSPLPVGVALKIGN